MSRLSLSDFPREILDHIFWIFVSDLSPGHAVTSLLTVSRYLYSLVLPKLYNSITIHSFSQLDSFLSPSSGAHRYCRQYTTGELVIHLADVATNEDGNTPFLLSHAVAAGSDLHPGCDPGTVTVTDTDTDADSMTPPFHDRLLKASQALLLCPKVQHVCFKFFSIRHSELHTSSEFRHNEAQTLERAFESLVDLESFRWLPPSTNITTTTLEPNVVVVVDQVIQPLARGLSYCRSLQLLELYNTMLPFDRGAMDLVQIVSCLPILPRRSQYTDQDDFESPLVISLSTITHLDPYAIATMTLGFHPTPFGRSTCSSSQPLWRTVQIHITDGFINSICGPKINKQIIETEMRKNLYNVVIPQSNYTKDIAFEDAIHAALQRIHIATVSPHVDSIS